jgi:predicted nicotinamide N-methyase
VALISVVYEQVCGIHLNLITSNNDIYYMKDDNDLPFPSPYWGFVWPGGLGLTRYIVENSIIFKNKRVLDVGSGCGVSSIAAAQAGAKEVVANDICPYAHDALLLNMELNSYPIHNSTISFCEENLIFKNKEYFDQFDVILCGDMLYDADFSRQLMNALCHHEMVIFGDPERTYCPEKLDESNSVLATYDYQCDGFAR